VATRAAVQSDGFAWRILLGPAHDWPVVKAESNMTEQQLPAMERCEFCRGPIDSSRPFTTNSAGEQPVHLECLEEDAEMAGSGHRSIRRMWGRWLRKLFPLFESFQQSQLSPK
jgi:hypothetical protein